MYYLCYDIETTGLIPGQHEICEIGALLMDSSYNILQAFGADVHCPNFSQADPKALALNKFTAERNEAAAPFNTVWLNMMADLSRELKATNDKDIMVVMHNAPFDTAFTLRALQNSEKFTQQYKKNFRRVLDTVTLGHALLGGPLMSLAQLSDALLNRYHRMFWKPHSALSDAMQTALVFREMMERMDKYAPTAEQMRSS